MTIKICDICGEHMVDCGNSYNITETEYDGTGTAVMDRYTADICPSCINKLKEKLKEMGATNLRWDG